MKVNNFILTIDVGNTHSKASLLDEKHTILSTFPLSDLDKKIPYFQLNAQNTLAGISSVKSQFQQHIPFKQFLVADYFHSSGQHSSFLDMPVHYTKTLGLDRLIQAWYLYYHLHHSKKKMLLIDTGTFTTVDFIDETGLKGGLILPGLGTILNSYSQGDQLRSHLLNNDNKVNTKKIETKELNLLFQNIPHSTNDAIEAGALITFLAPLLTIIHQNPDYKLVITGGNAHILNSYLQSQHQDEVQPLASIHFEMNLIHIAIAAFVQVVNKKEK